VLNGANETAVRAFIEERVSFLQIPKVIEHVLRKHAPTASPSLKNILDADAWAREEARAFIARH
jgi:1-deoxy-D-xylulose-5-phosphate reductoisomerase